MSVYFGQNAEIGLRDISILFYSGPMYIFLKHLYLHGA